MFTIQKNGPCFVRQIFRSKSGTLLINSVVISQKVSLQYESCMGFKRDGCFSIHLDILSNFINCQYHVVNIKISISYHSAKVMGLHGVSKNDPKTCVFFLVADFNCRISYMLQLSLFKLIPPCAHCAIVLGLLGV